MTEALDHYSGAEVIHLLEQALAAAKVKRFATVAVVLGGYGEPGKDSVHTAVVGGDVNLEEAQADACVRLSKVIREAAGKRKLPPRDPKLDKSHVCYNLCLQSISFDFLNWLVDCEMERIASGAPAPLKVSFFKGVGEVAIHRIEFLDKVFRPALKFIGAVEDDKAALGHNKVPTVLRDVVNASRAGAHVPKFKTDKKPRSSLEGAVTITLREAAHSPGRNSDNFEWIKFAGWLRDRGENVVFVRDTAKALEPFGDFATCPEASLDLAERLALYESAKVNYFSENGPVTLAIFGTRPWVSFVDIRDDFCPEAARTPFFWKELFDMKPGDQYPWSTPDQRIVWKEATYENMIESWHEVADRPPLRLVRA